MKTNTLETRLGVFFAMAMIAAFIILELVGGVNILRPGFHLFAEFNNIQDLKVGDPVKIAGVPIGQVDHIGLDETNNKVLLRLRLHSGVIVRTDSQATIKFAGLLGQNYVAITFGTPAAPAYTDGQRLVTAEQPDLSALMAKLDEAASGVQNLTKSFTGDKIDNLLGPFTDFMRQNNPKLTAMIANFSAVSTQIAQGKGTVGKLIYDDALYTSALSTVTNFQGVSGDLKLTLGDARGMIGKARGMMDDVNAGHGTVGKLLKDEALYRATTDSMTNLKEILQKVNKGDGTVSKLINDQEFYKNAKLSLQKLDKATEGLEDAGPLSILGSMLNSLL